MSAPAPTLTDELIELVLVANLRRVTTRPTPASLASVLPALSITTRSMAPAVIKAALNDLPWIDLDYASCIGDTRLMDLMVDMEKRRNGRPLQWTHNALIDAARSGHVHVLDWWLKQRHLQVEWVSLLKPALHSGHVNVLEWWSQSGLKMYFPSMMHEDFRALAKADEFAVWIHEHRDRLVHEREVEKSSQRAMQYVQELIDSACSPGLFRWAHASGDYVVPDWKEILKVALKCGTMDVIDWVVSTLVSKEQLHKDLPYILRSELCHYRAGGTAFCAEGLPDMPWNLWCDCKLRRTWFMWFIESSAVGSMLLDIAGLDHMKRLIGLMVRAGDVDLLRKLEAQRPLPPLSNGVLWAAIESGDLASVDFVLERIPDSAMVEQQCSCSSCARDLFVKLPRYGISFLIGHGIMREDPTGVYVMAVLDRLLARGYLPKPERVKECLEKALNNQVVPLINWWMQQRDCAVLLAQDPTLLAALIPAMTSLPKACQTGNVPFLEWWLDQLGHIDFENALTPKAVVEAAQQGHVEVLKFLCQHVPHLVREYAMYPEPVERLSQGLHADEMYGWSSEHETLIDRLSLCYYPQSVEASLKVLDWWFNESELPMYYTERAMDTASRHGVFPILDWWLSHADQLELKYTRDFVPLNKPSQPQPADPTRFW